MKKRQENLRNEITTSGSFCTLLFPQNQKPLRSCTTYNGDIDDLNGDIDDLKA